MKKVSFVIFICILLFSILGSYVYNYVQDFGLTAGYNSNENQQLTLILRKGDSANSVLSKLEKIGLVKEPLIAKLWLKLHPEYSQVKKGYYQFGADSNVNDIFAALSAGKVKQFSITLIEGLTLRQWLVAIRMNKAISNDIVDVKALYDNVVAPQTSFCINPYSSLEGCLLANTYFFDHGTKASDIIKRAYNSMRTVIDVEWSSRFQDTAYKTKYEMLIMASIIEKETAVESERGLISGVFDNRLKRKMRLQTDPTVIYGIGEAFDGNLTRKHLRQKTPYNTYVIKGLPITPIAMAGPASINAAAQPETTESVYFVAKGDGSHKFSETLAEHNAAVRQYQLRKGKK